MQRYIAEILKKQALEEITYYGRFVTQLDERTDVSNISEYDIHWVPPQ